MASDFYQRTAALCEEFEKSEPSENIILQDSLRKINRREKETEETYKNLMKQLGELDQRIELMSFKLDKLNVLKDSVTSTRISSWPEGKDTFDKNLRFYHPSSASLNSTVGFNHSLLNPNYQIASTNPNYQAASTNTTYQTVSTQTDFKILCEECNFPLSMKQNLSVKENMGYYNEIHDIPETASFAPSSAIENSGIVTQRLQQNFKNKAQENLDFNQLASNTNVTGSSFKTSESSSVLASKSSFLTEDAPETLKLNNNHFSDAVSNSIQLEKVLETYENKNISVIQKSSVEGESSNVILDYDTNQITLIRSDDESINHEFDFLESSKKNYMEVDSAHNFEVTTDSLVQTVQQKGEQDHVPFHQDSSTAEGVTYSKQDNVIESRKIRNKKHSNIKNVVNDRNYIKTDSSLSAGELHSPSIQSENVSTASESDSIYEKESPLTATAAYQAMLGNVAATENVSKNTVVSDSDSEDEVENALTTAVRKTSSVPLDATFVVRKEEKSDSFPYVEHETASRTSKSATANKPQSKLSKSTRKVLGLDTSSGSEVEIETKIPKSNNVDDDDEFDFYD